jgi:hypothetical protein
MAARIKCFELLFKYFCSHKSQLTVNLIRGSGAFVGELGNDGRFPVIITITNGGKAGTVSSDLEGTLSLSDVQLSKGHVSANWTCGSKMNQDAFVI